MKRLLKQYFRNLITNKLNALITILGFSISIAVVIILVFFIIQEKSYDKEYSNIDNIYRLVTTKNESFVEEDAKEILINKYPQILSACRYHNYKTHFVYNQGFYEGQFITTDEGFFDVFSVQFIHGSKKTAFSNIQGIVLTESFAKQIFGNNNPVDQIIRTVADKEFQVTGVVKNLPKYSSIAADCFIHYKHKIYYSAINGVFTTKFFMVVQPGTIIKDFEKEVSQTLVESSKILNNNPINYVESIEWKLRPFKAAYFETDILNDHLLHANIKLIQIISIISLTILILAIINYVNLNTAESISRIKEIGIRKINGAGKRNIFQQFLYESLITCILASGLAFLFTQLIAPIFKDILGRPVDFIEFSFLNIFIILLCIFILGIASGLSPALIASQYSPIQLYHSKFKVSLKTFLFRNVLITFQFTISTVMIIVLIVILKQIQFSQSRDIGFDPSYLVRVNYPDNISRSNVIRDYLQKNSNVLNVSFSEGSPMNIDQYKGGGDPIESIGILSTDDQFIETFKLELLQGRNINYPSEIKECLITDNAYKESGWESLDNKIYEDHKVVGVINTFNSDDLHQIAQNVMITNSGDNFSSVNIRINPNDISGTLDFIKQTWDTFFPEFGFRYSFYDEWVEKSFIKERNHARIAFVFGILSIVLSCLGLYGLVNYSLKQRIKEIGIRKINGAKASEILKLVNLGFLKWVIIAFIIACPLAVYIIDKWLSNFAYKTTLDWWIFIFSGLIVTVFALLTISWKSFKAANRNPIESLRYE